ncbi:hypothetical protein ACFWNN_13865 [Lentzea sp. NPDC058450]|uniref:hypothetical protein n=1 Tax=Lentzea sp. NPDC058450 TaxID=3346505 RepID=UPI0036547398
MASQFPSYVDTAFHDEELMNAGLALKYGDLEPALALLAATRDQPYRRELAVDFLGAVGNMVLPVLLNAEEERPEDVNLLLLLGSAQTTAGWQSRGAAYAKDTSDEQFGGLINFTQRARRTLHRAAEMDPDDVAPWAALMPVALGAPTHRSEAAEVYAEVVKRVPDLVNATLRRLQSTAAKWYGSHDEMFAFARAGVAGLPDGHPLLALIPIAHIERYLSLLSADSFLVRLWRVITSRYLRKQRAEVDAASDRLLAGPDGQPHSLWAHQIFAMYYHETKTKDRLRSHLGRSGPRAASWPWGYFGDHDERFEQAHRMAALD